MRRVGFLYVLSVPVTAGLASMSVDDIGGFAYTGWMWVGSLVVGILVIQADMALFGRFRGALPYGPWGLWFGFVWLSLLWSEGSGRNLQEALQITMPLLVGTAASMFITSETQLRTLLRVVCLTALPLAATLMWLQLGWADDATNGTSRVLALTTALIGCVFISGSPRSRLGPILGWAVCLTIIAVSGSRTATAALLAVPALHPLHRNLLRRGAIIATTVALAVMLFYTPLFQERFFDSEYGSLDRVLNGNFIDSGRFAAWPPILDEAWQHPVFGAGVGSAHDFVPTVWPEVVQVHNDYLRIGFEQGLVGLVIFLSVMAWQLRDLTRQIGRSDGYAKRAFAASFLGLLIFLLTSVTDNTLAYNLWYVNPLFAVMGAAYGVARCGGPDSADAGQRGAYA
jgi:O-antigen ligase